MKEQNPSLSPETIEALTPLPWADRSKHLLTGKSGPLSEGNAAFSDDVAGLAYLLRLIWRVARKQDQYQKLAVYEARERFGARARSEASASGSVHEYAIRLLRKVGGSLDTLSPPDLLWLRCFAPGASVAMIRDRNTIEEALAGAHLVDSWLWEVSAALRQDGDPNSNAEDSALLAAQHAFQEPF